MTQEKLKEQNLKISAGTLGRITRCKRCFYIANKNKKLPFSIFPGIFSSIDSFTKKAVRSSTEKFGVVPNFLQENYKSKIKGFPEKTGYMKFDIPNLDFTLTGIPDEILELSDNTWSIIDYKTARYSDTQRDLFGIYQIQLNVYAYMFEQINNVKVSKLALVYMEPYCKIEPKNVSKIIVEHNSSKDDNGIVRSLALPFEPTFVEVEKNTKKFVFDPAKEAKDLLAGKIPAYKEGTCKDCDALRNLNIYLKGINEF